MARGGSSNSTIPVYMQIEGLNATAKNLLGIFSREEFPKL